MNHLTRKNRFVKWSVSLSLTLLACQGFLPTAVAVEAAEGEPQAVDSKPLETNGLPIDDAHFGESLKWYLDAHYDKNKDGFLSESELNNATSVNIDAIAGSEEEYEVDLRGFEYLPNMRSIVLGRSDGQGGIPVIKNMDTTSLNLSTLKFYGPKFVNSTIDLRKSTNAKTLKLDGNYSDLGRLLPEKAFNLIYLDVSGIPLKTLDVSGYPNLETISALFTHIDQLNLENNKNINSISVESPNLKTLNVSTLSHLTRLHVSNSPLKALDITNNIELERITVTNTEIASIDLSKLNKVEWVNIRNNHLATLDLTNQPKLTLLGLNVTMNAPNFKGVPNESIDGMIQQDPQTHSWQVDFTQWIPADQLTRISMKEYTEDDWSYDAKTGLATYLKAEKPDFIDYKYETNSVKADNWSKNTAMYVRATLTQGFTVQAKAMKGGTITPTGNAVYHEGETPTYTIIPDAGYGIDQVTVDGKEVSLTDTNTYTFDPIQADHQLEVTFRSLPVVTASATVGGQVTPMGETAYAFGAEAVYTVEPDSGYRIKQVLVDGKEVALTENTFTFTNLQANHTFTVSFEEKPKVGKIDSPTQLTRSLTEIETYLAEHPTETVESYVLNQLNPKGSYTFEGETTLYEIPVTLTFLPGSVTQPLEVGTYGGLLVLDPTVWSGEAVTQPIQLIVTERTLPPVDPTPPVEPGDPTGPTDPSLPVDPSTPAPPTEGTSVGHSETTSLPQTGEQPSSNGLIGLLMVGVTGLLFMYKKKKVVGTKK